MGKVQNNVVQGQLSKDSYVSYWKYQAYSLKKSLLKMKTSAKHRVQIQSWLMWIV